MIDELRQIGGELDDGGSESEDLQKIGQVVAHYPANYYAQNPDAPQLEAVKIREDRELRRKKKEILNAFNAKRKALKEQMINVSNKPPMPLTEARKKKIVESRASSHAQIAGGNNTQKMLTSSASDDGFMNYEENKKRLESANLIKTKNMEAVKQS